MVLHALCILGTAETIGALHASSIRAASHDPLTGLLNRAGADHAAQQLLADARTNRQMVSAVVIDIDRFKKLNDSRGHTAGDHALIDLASALTTAVPDTGLVARLGGDEFLVLLRGLDEGAAEVLAQALASRLPLAVTHGIASADFASCDLGDLVHRADLDLYRRRAARRGEPPPAAVKD